MPDTIYTAFNFLVEITVKGVPGVPEDGYEAGFAELDGLEVTMEPKTFTEGGNNTQQIHLAGPVTYAQLTLKRGMTKDFGLWHWFAEILKYDKRGLRAQITITMLGADKTPQVIFKLRDCLPTKIRAPALNAKEGALAIEEMQIAYASFDVELP